MILIKNHVAPSNIQGLGVTADEFIPAGTVFWRHLPGLDLTWSKEDFAQLPPQAQETIRHYGYLDRASQHWMLGFDNDRFMNHSENPNITDKGGEVIVGQDIHPGDEITCNYKVFDDDWEYKLRDINIKSPAVIKH